MANIPLDQIQVTTPLDDISEGFVAPSGPKLKNRTADIAVTTGANADEIVESEVNGDQSKRAEARNTIGDPVNRVLEDSTRRQVAPEEATKNLRETAEKKSDIDSYMDFVLEGAMTVDDPRFSPSMARIAQNQQSAMEILESKFTRDQGTMGKVFDWADRYLIRQIGIGTYEDLTRRSERLGREVALNAASMSPSEFNEWFEGYAEELAQEGVFTSENFFALQQGFYEATNAGYAPDSGMNQALAVLDVAGVAAAATGPARATLRSGTVLTRVGNLKGPKAASQAYKRLRKSGLGDEPEILNESLPSHIDPGTHPEAVKPDLATVSQIAQENRIIQDIEYLTKVGTFGRQATPEEVDLAVTQVQTKVRESIARPVAQENILDIGLDNKAVQFKLGKQKDASPFKTDKAAQKYANQLNDKGLSARVEPVSTFDESMGYYVTVEERVDLSTVAGQMDTHLPLNGFQDKIARALGSTTSIDNARVDVLAKQGESGAAAIQEVVRPWLSKINRLNYDSKVAVGQIFRDLRDGPDAYMRTAYSESEFKDKFKLYHPKGKDPTEADFEAYNAIQTVNDAAYVLKANSLATRYVRLGYKSLDIGGVNVNAKVVDNVPREAAIFNAATGRTIGKADLGPETAIWKVDHELEGGIEYVTQPNNVRSIMYHDVLNYNAGGIRTNPNANYFVSFGEGRGTAMLSSFSAKQARKAVDELTQIQSALKATGRQLDDLTDELDDVIGRNNSWNPSIEDTADLKALAARKGWRLDQNISYKARGDLLESEEELFSGMTQADFITTSRKRNNDVLMEYGGNENYNHSPVGNIVQQLSNTASEYSFRNYIQVAKTSWVKKALRVDEIPEGRGVNELFDTIEPKGVEASRMESLRTIIRRKESFETDTVRAMKRYGQELAEFVFDKTGVKINWLSKDPTNIMLNLGFRSAFGFMNIFQFFLQASHAFSVMAISPVQGLRGSGTTLALRWVLHAPDPDGAILRRFAKATGMETKDAKELITYIRTSGRDLVEADAMEKGTGPGFGLSGWEGQSFLPSSVRKGLYQTTKTATKVDEWALTPFREGERLSRMTSMVTAFLEYKKKFKGADALTDSARTWITRREQDLTFNMTTTSRAAWQNGLMRVPTQWLSYSFRVMETLMIGRNFSKAERARLGIFLAAQGGLAGFGLASMADYVSEELGVDADSKAYAGIKYGLFDAFLSNMISDLSGEEIRTAIGTRLAPLTAFTDIAKKLSEENAITALGGPSGEIVGGGLASLITGVGHLFNGNTQSAMQDIERAVRTPSGVDQAWKAIGIMNDGTYRTKTGTQMDMEFSDVEGLMQLMGVTNFKVADFYQSRTEAFRSSRQVKAFSKEVVKDFQTALRKINDGDQEGGYQLMREIEARIQTSGFSPYDMAQIRKQLKADTSNDVVTMIMEMLKRDRKFGADRVESYIQ